MLHPHTSDASVFDSSSLYGGPFYFTTKNAIAIRGHLFAIVTGRRISHVVQLFKNSGASDEDIQRMEISGEYGAAHKGPSTDGEIKVREDLIKYSPIGKEILNTIEARINKNKMLNDKVEISRKTLGGTIHHTYWLESLEAHIQQGEEIDLK